MLKLNKKTIGRAVPLKVKQPYEYHYPNGKTDRFPSADAMLIQLSHEAWLKTAQAKRYYMERYGVESTRHCQFPIFVKEVSEQYLNQYNKDGAAWRKQYRELLRPVLISE